jgi:MFS transporter, DHA1 family, multidrug resistance protein
MSGPAPVLTSDPAGGAAVGGHWADGHRRRFHTVVLIAGIGFGLTAPFTSLLAVTLGASGATAGMVVSSMGLSLLLVDYFGTRFVPRLNPRWSMTLSMTIFAAGSFLSALAPTWALVMTARILQGFGTALFMGSGLQTAVRLAAPGREGSSIGGFNAAWFAGVSSGPLAGGLIAEILGGLSGLRLLFAVCGAANLIGAVTAWLLTPALPAVGRPRLGLPAGTGLRGWRSAGALGLSGLGQAVRAGIALTLVPLLGDSLGFGTLVLGVALSALAATDISTMTLGGRWADRAGRRRPLGLALAWGVVAAVLITRTHSLATFTLCALALGVTVGATWVLPAAMVVDLASDPEPALAVYRICCDLGMLAGGLAAGVGIGLAGERGAFLGAAGVLATGLLVTLAVGETRRPSRPSPFHLRPLPPPRLAEASGPAPAVPPPDPFLEVLVPLPSVDGFAVIAANQDITFLPERLARAHAVHERMRPGLDRLRALPLSFTEPVIEPATGDVWLAKGGRSA